MLLNLFIPQLWLTAVWIFRELKDQALCNWEIVQYSISSVGLGLKIYVFLGNHMIKNRLLESEIFFFIFLVLKHIFT